MTAFHVLAVLILCWAFLFVACALIVWAAR